MGRRNRAARARWSRRKTRVWVPRRKRQRVCGKLGYRDQAEARNALKLARNSHLEKGMASVETRAYECPRCGCWHLTSQPQRSVST